MPVYLFGFILRRKKLTMIKITKPVRKRANPIVEYFGSASDNPIPAAIAAKLVAKPVALK